MTVIKPENIHFVLVGTTHSGNIGAAARAMKTMGFNSLRLVQACPHLTKDAFSRASGADGIVREALEFETLADAVADCTTVFGTSGRSRSVEWSVRDPRESAEMIGSGSCGQTIAVVFGQERSGLTNDELDICTYQLQIPSHPGFSSLNLGSAVQVLAYELRVMMLARAEEGLRAVSPGVVPEVQDSPVQVEDYSDSESMERFFVHLEQTLIDIDFLDPTNPRLLMRRLRRYFGRNRPFESEMNILRGVLTAASKR